MSQGRAILSASKRLAALEEQRKRASSAGSDERIAEEMCKKDESQRDAVEEIEKLFSQVRDAIRQRIAPTPGSVW